ncbi:DUF397 domain-containing protein [Actinomadura rugatobispora]|uniref:DUF397 domain-containing protein n=1 Tax=Actinomadura rugatobispora TaxID=1994 RepID=A0ABW1AIK5_9ACTN|nr:DUF397 domain-containing protein [Actinomadura rugatobispora]
MDLSTTQWRKSSRSSNNGGHCIEVASISNAVLVRDSKDPEGPKLPISRQEFRRFTDAIKRV